VFVIDDVKPRRDGPVRGYGGKMGAGKICRMYCADAYSRHRRFMIRGPFKAEPVAMSDRDRTLSALPLLAPNSARGSSDKPGRPD